MQYYQSLAPTSSDSNPVFAATAAANDWAFITYTATQQGLNDQQVFLLTFDLQLSCSFNDASLNLVWYPAGGLQSTATAQSVPLYNPLNADGPYGQAGPYLAVFFPVVHYLAPAGPIGTSLTPTAFFPWLGIPQVTIFLSVAMSTACSAAHENILLPRVNHCARLMCCPLSTSPCPVPWLCHLFCP